MLMNLSQLRSLTDTPKTAFDARRRQGSYVWLGDDALLGEEIGGGRREKYNLSHALGLATMDRALRKGVGLVQADRLGALACEGAVNAPSGWFQRGPIDQHLFVGFIPLAGGELCLDFPAGTLDEWVKCLKKVARGNDVDHPHAPDGLFLQDITLLWRRLQERLMAGMTKVSGRD
ncbi:MAG: hypothetical protein U9R73_01450 [Pseudomonadota bacterium]|nr:hypothetical protein [Pseudomonadota bacterium]